MATLNPPPQPGPPPVSGAEGRLKRRSSRLTIQIPVEVICKDSKNALRVEESQTVIVNAHGCALTLKQGILAGEKVVVIHKMSREEMICRVVMCRQGKGLWDVGLEFQKPAPMFWHIAFPPDDWDASVLESSPPTK